MKLDEINAILNIFLSGAHEICFVDLNIQQTFVIHIYVFYISTTHDSSSKFIVADLSIAVERKFIIVYVYIILYASKVSVNTAQPLLTTI